jgi:hypothetical protein
MIISHASFKLPEDRTILVVGDSHSECAINDDIFTHGVNVSQMGNAYLYSYVKIKKFLEENTRIDTILLSFHYIILTKEFNSWVDSDIVLPQYFTLYTADEWLIYIKNPAFFKSLFKFPVSNVNNLLKFVITGQLTYKDLYIGGYQRLDRDKLKEDIDRQNNDSLEINEEYSWYQLHYLLKIVDLCSKKNVELILFNSPIYDSAKYGANDNLLKYYNIYLRGIKYMDYSDFPLPEFGYGDISHLNYKGAEIFSHYLEKHYQEIFR